MSDTTGPRPPTLTAAIPGCAPRPHAPPIDQLPEGTTLTDPQPPPTQTQGPTGRLRQLLGPRSDTSQPSGPDTPRPPTDSTSDRPRRWVPSGDVGGITEVLAGLLILGTVALGGLSARRGRRLRQPTLPQVDDIAGPLASIACRHLPMAAIGPDLLDISRAAGGVHRYVACAPLTAAVSHVIDPEE